MCHKPFIIYLLLSNLVNLKFLNLSYSDLLSHTHFKPHIFKNITDYSFRSFIPYVNVIIQK